MPVLTPIINLGGNITMSRLRAGMVDMSKQTPPCGAPLSMHRVLAILGSLGVLGMAVVPAVADVELAVADPSSPD